MLTFILTVFTGFFAVMNPITNIPIFLSLTDGFSSKEQKQIAKKSTMIAFIIVVLFILGGKYILQLFGITIPAFRIAGGIIIFYIGFEMLQSKRSSIHSNNHSQEELDAMDIAISPLATPILAGPGTIVTSLNFAVNNSFVHTIVIIIVFGLITLLSYIAFVFAEKIVELLGHGVIKVIRKLMGLILAVIGIDMIITGIKSAFKI